jgi:dTDP-4-dehydrorhamnose reductase
LRVVADQVGTPTSAALIAEVTAAALRQSTMPRPMPSGLWHLTAHGQTSWHGFAEAIVEGAFERGLIARKPSVVPIATTDFPTRARRPAYSCLDNSGLPPDLRSVVHDWRDGLQRVLDELGANRG